MKRYRRPLLSRVALAGWALGCAAILVQGVAAEGAAAAVSIAADQVVVSRAASDSQDARGLRLGLLGLLGLALGGGAFVQYKAAISAPPATMERRRCERPARPARPQAQPVPEPGAQPDTPPRATTPPPSPQPAEWQVTRPQPIRLEAHRRHRQETPRVAHHAPPLTPAERECERAIRAAHRYDRATTLAAFATALTDDPGVKPSALPGFWEMPASGHADLARVYLRRGQRLDARTLLSLALLTLPHNRELATLLRDTEGYREETA